MSGQACAEDSPDSPIFDTDCHTSSNAADDLHEKAERDECDPYYLCSTAGFMKLIKPYQFAYCDGQCKEPPSKEQARE
jgi:hypothetical protein